MAALPLRARRFLATATLSAHLGALAGPALAQTEEPSREAIAEERRNEAKSEFEKGAEHYRAERYKEAVIAFLAADRLAPSPALSFNIARAYERLDDTSGALRWYRDYLRRKPGADNEREVQERVRALTAAIVGKGLQQITILSTPTGASVAVDGQDVGVTPYTGEHALGEHAIAVQASDRPERRLTVNLEPAEAEEITVDLGEAPLHTERPLTPAAAPSEPAPLPQPAPERPLGVAPYIVAGAGAALLVGSLGFELARRGQESKAEEARNQIEFRDHVDTMEDHKTTSRILLGIGGVALVTGGALYLLNERREKPTPVAFGCSPFGCAARGTF